MAKKKQEDSLKTSSLTQNGKKKRNPKNNKKRGNDLERKIAAELRDVCCPGVVTSRSESKAMDDMKIDIIDKEDKLPCYVQIKRTIATPDYFKIREECPLKDRPFVLFWNKQKPTESTFRSVGEVVFCDKDFFYELLKKYVND